MMNQATDYARYITARLGDKIALIILFGSLTKNNVTNNSDIDILVIHFGDIGFEKQLAAETFNFMVKTGAPIEYLSYGYFEVKNDPTYFVKYNMDNGVKLYMMDLDDLKKKEIEGYIKLSSTFEESARVCFNQNYIRAAIDLGYNAIELKVKALLLKILKDLPGTHGGLVSKFGEHYIQTKKIPKEIGHKLNEALSLRNKARYDPQAKLVNDDWNLISLLNTELLKVLG